MTSAGDGERVRSGEQVICWQRPGTAWGLRVAGGPDQHPQCIVTLPRFAEVRLSLTS